MFFLPLKKAENCAIPSGITSCRLFNGIVCLVSWNVNTYNLLENYVPGGRAYFHDVGVVCCKLFRIFFITPDCVSFLLRSCMNTCSRWTKKLKILAI